MKRTALTGLLAAGILVMPVHRSLAQTNPPPDVTLVECATVLMIGSLMALEVFCVIERWHYPGTNGISMTSPPDPNFPVWTNAPPSDPQPTNAPPAPKAVLKVDNALVSIPITDGSMLDTNGPVVAPYTNYLTFAVATGNDLTALHRAYEFRVWQSPFGHLVHMTDEAGNQLWSGYTLKGQTNRVPIYLDMSAPRQFYKLLSQ